MSGSIEVIQKNKTVFSDKAIYYDDHGSIVLSSNVKAVIKKLKNIIKKKSSEKIKGEEAKKTLQETTVINCDKLTVSTDNGDCTASGNVLVTQKEQEAKADNAVYTEKGENIVMTGNVYMKRKDAWVKANKVIVHVENGIFEAKGQVETEFTVKKGARKIQ